MFVKFEEKKVVTAFSNFMNHKKHADYKLRHLYQITEMQRNS